MHKNVGSIRYIVAQKCRQYTLHEPKFQVSFQNQRYARSLRASTFFRDRSRPCFITCACDVDSTFKGLIVVERARPCSSGRRVPDCAVWARSGRIISVQNGEHSFCSKRRHDEEKSFNGPSFLPAKQGASSAEPPFFWSLGIRGRNQ